MNFKKMVLAAVAMVFAFSAHSGELVKKKDSFAAPPPNFAMAHAVEKEECHQSGDIGMSEDGLILSCQSDVWEKQGPSYNSNIGPDWGIIELADGLELMWQAYQMDSCVPSEQDPDFTQHNAFCTVDVTFAQPFKENVYYVTVIGRDFAAGSSQGLSLEGSEMNFGIMHQDRFGARLNISRVVGSNAGGERMGFIVQAIGK